MERDGIMAIVCFIILPCLMLAGCRDHVDGIGNWTESIPQIRVHDMFVPHPHLKDLKAAAKRGKILVITLVVSAGLVLLVSTAILRGGKEKDEAGIREAIEPAELRACVIAAAIAGRRGLAQGKEQSLKMALVAYAKERSVEWVGQIQAYSETAEYSIGRDRVTIVISNDEKAVEARSTCGKMGASATANSEEDSIQSSIFFLSALEREGA
jgi:hypothetical protein